MKKKKPMKEQYWGGDGNYDRHIEVAMSKKMYLFLKETAERCDTSMSSLVRQSIRAMKREFEWDREYGRGKETK